jgi:lantibiotic leader peptide-processing serine protease
MRLFATILTAVLTLALASSASAAGTAQIASDRYTVLLAGTQTGDGFEAAAAPAAVRSAVSAAGGTVVRDLSRQVGMLVVTSPSPAFADVLRGTGLVEDVGRDFKWRGKPSGPGGGPFQTQDLLEPMQWDMQQIRTPQAHDVQAGARSVDVGILDSGIDGRHPEFTVGPQGTNVDCARGRNSITFVPEGPGVGTPDPCTDNQFHGTHVAGTVGMQANQLGMVGVAPNVTLVPVKVCDTTGYCYASPVVDGITYAGDQQFDVINMSFCVDDSRARSAEGREPPAVECDRHRRARLRRVLRPRADRRAPCGDGRDGRSARRDRAGLPRVPGVTRGRRA